MALTCFPGGTNVHVQFAAAHCLTTSRKPIKRWTQSDTFVVKCVQAAAVAVVVSTGDQLIAETGRRSEPPHQQTSHNVWCCGVKSERKRTKKEFQNSNDVVETDEEEGMFDCHLMDKYDKRIH